MSQVKRGVLLAICEHPGWEPEEPISSSVDHSLGALAAEGWIVARNGGWEATPKALEEYPAFRVQEDIASPPERGEDGRPLQTIANQSDTWSQSFRIPRITITDRQKIETGIDLGSVKGSIVVVNTDKEPSRYELEVVVNLRRIEARP